MAFFSKLGNYKNFGLLIIRVGLGFMFIYHGYPKLTGGVPVWEKLGGSVKYAGIHFLPTAWGLLAALSETLGGVLLILGLAFRPVCILLVINLIVAALFHFGTGEGLMGASHAIEDAIMFAGLLFVGPGRYSVDKR
ncbi:MAG: DoxX family protein [Mucilaginibacter sp.]